MRCTVPWAVHRILVPSRFEWIAGLSAIVLRGAAAASVCAISRLHLTSNRFDVGKGWPGW